MSDRNAQDDNKPKQRDQLGDLDDETDEELDLEGQTEENENKLAVPDSSLDRLDPVQTGLDEAQEEGHDKDELDGQVEGSDEQRDESLESAIENADSSTEADVYDPAALAAARAARSLGKRKAVTKPSAAAPSATPEAAQDKGAIADATAVPKAVNVQTPLSDKPGTAPPAADKPIDSDKSEKLAEESLAQQDKSTVSAEVQPPLEVTRNSNPDAEVGAPALTATTASYAKPASMSESDVTSAPEPAGVGGSSTSGDQAFSSSTEPVTDAEPGSPAQTSSASDTAFFGSTETASSDVAGSAPQVSSAADSAFASFMEPQAAAEPNTSAPDSVVDETSVLSATELPAVPPIESVIP